MPALLHNPARVLRQLLIDLGLGVQAAYAAGVYTGGAWPVFASGEPPTPDECLTVRGTLGTDFGYSQPGGELLQYHGFQVRVRAGSDETGYARASSILAALNEGGYPVAVTVESTPYCVGDAWTKGVIPLGKETPESKRSLFTINGLLFLVL